MIRESIKFLHELKNIRASKLVLNSGPYRTTLPIEQFHTSRECGQRPFWCTPAVGGSSVVADESSVAVVCSCHTHSNY